MVSLEFFLSLWANFVTEQTTLLANYFSSPYTSLIFLHFASLVGMVNYN